MATNTSTVVYADSLKTSIILEKITTKYNDTTTITVGVVDELGNNVTTGRVILKINGKTLKDTTGNIIFTDVVNGIATVKYTIPSNFKAKSYTLTAVFSDNYYNRVDVTSKFDIITQTKSLSTLRIDTSIITDAKPIQSNNSKTTIQNNYILPKAVKV